MHWLVTAFIIAPAGWLFFRRSTYLIDYLIWVSVFNRGIRRVVDWYEGAFNPFNAISLTPQLIGLFIVILVFQDWNRVQARLRWSLAWIGWALAYGLAIGLVYNKFAAVYEFSDYAVPIAAMVFAYLHGGTDKVLDRWIAVIGWAGIAAALYGWYQYFTIPPWDAMWVEAVGFEGYLGKLAPTEMAVFSTFGEKGPCATFLAWAVIPMLVHKRWKSRLGWMAPVLLLATILVTYARTSLLSVAMVVILFPLLGRGRSTIRTGMLLGAAILAVPLGLRLLPSADLVQQRVETLGTFREDGSYLARIDIMRETLGIVARHPLGLGLGSTGNAGRINTGEIQASEVASDGGYNRIIVSFGILGSSLFFFGIYSLFRELINLERLGFVSEKTVLMKALFAMVAVTLYIGNMLVGTTTLIFWLLLGHIFASPRTLRFCANPRTVVPWDRVSGKTSAPNFQARLSSLGGHARFVARSPGAKR